jgi:hypothetical protein
MPVWRRVLPSRHELSSHGTAGCLLVVSPQGRAPDAELGPGLALLPPRVKQFMSVDPYFEPSSDGTVRWAFPSSDSCPFRLGFYLCHTCSSSRNIEDGNARTGGEDLHLQVL